MIDVSKELAELEAAIARAEDSAEEFVAETRGGAGTPAERRMADAFSDFNGSFRAMARCVDGIEQGQREMRAALDAVAAMPDELERTVEFATGRYMRTYGSQLDHLREKADETIGALGKLDETAADEYRAAVGKSTKLLVSFTAGAAGALALLAVVGGFWAMMGAAFWVRASPDVQQFAATPQGLAVGIAVPLAVFAVGALVGYKRGKSW